MEWPLEIEGGPGLMDAETILRRGGSAYVSWGQLEEAANAIELGGHLVSINDKKRTADLTIRHWTRTLYI